jgi:hypothetical protein
MFFKEWLGESLLLEFRSSNFYDFYALELASREMDTKEVNDLLVDRGNSLYSEIMSALGFLLFLRYGSVVRQCLKTNDEIEHSGNLGLLDFPEKVRGNSGRYIDIMNLVYGMPRVSWTHTIRQNREAYDSWFRLGEDEQRELVYISRELLLHWEYNCHTRSVLNTLSRQWDNIYDYFINNANKGLITNPVVVIKMINSLTQLVHNNGNILQYMPEELDKAIHIRDTARLGQLLYGASATVKGLLRSASLPSGGLVEEMPPALPQLFLTAMSRNMDKYSDIKHIELLESRRDEGGDFGLYRVHGKLGDSDCVFNFSLKKKRLRWELPVVELDLGSVRNVVLDRLKKNDWYNVMKYLEVDDSEILSRKINYNDFGEIHLDYIGFGKRLLDYIDSVLGELKLFYDNILKYGVWHRG